MNEYKLCSCIQIKELPSIFCSRCGEMNCIICSNFYKCKSCSSFCCEDCNISLLCKHTYCSVKCALQNEERVCNNYCFFLRDIETTDSDNQGLNNLLFYWIKKAGKDEVKMWIMSIKREINNPEIIEKNKKLDIHIGSIDSL